MRRPSTAGSWLYGCIPRKDKVHFVYATIDAQPRDSTRVLTTRMNHVRVDAKTGKKDFHRRASAIRGTRIKVNKRNGFLATRRSDPDGPINLIGADDERLVCLVSTDNGET